MKHEAVVPVVGWQDVPGIDRPVPIYAETCAACDRPVRRVFGPRAAGRVRPLFWHSAGRARAGDARLGPRRAEHSAAIGAGMKAANARRKAARG